MHEFDRCEIHVDGRSVATGHVARYTDGVMRITTDKDTRIAEGSACTLFVMNYFIGECVYSGRVSSSAGRRVVVEGVTFIRSTQRRDNTRVNKHLNFTVATRFVNGAEETLPEPMRITMLNISAQGMCFMSSAVLEPGFVFVLPFTEGQRPLRLIVRVLRRGGEGGQYTYGCRFEISRREMDLIYRYVLSEQIRRRKEQLDA